MGVLDAPQWLVPAFVRSVLALGATATREQIEETGTALLSLWSSPDRHHHGVRHLVHVLERVDTLSQEVHNPEMVRVASWYHGAVFDATMHRLYRRAAGENKIASADLAKVQLEGLGISPKVAGRVRELILALIRHDADPTDVDSMALCDADLGTLAVEPQKYREYRKRVRREFELVPDRDYVEARIAIITKLLARRHLFLSPLAAPWEAPARQNLEAELVRLRTELASLPPRAEGEESIAEAPGPAPTSGAPIASDDSPAAEREKRPHTERFGRDDSYSVEDTTVLGMEPAPKLRSPEPETPEAPECIGVPFEERHTETKSADSRLVSNMERDPVDPSSLPRRVSVDDARKKAEKVREAPSTPSDRDDDSTGTLFRPIDR